MKESKSGEVDLSDEDEEAVEHMIHYFYYLDYLSTESESEPFTPINQKAPRFKLQDVEDPLIATASAVSNEQHTLSAVASSSANPTPAMESKPVRSSSPKPRTTRPRKYSRARRDSEAAVPTLTKHSPELSDDDSVEDEDVEETPDLVAHARVYALAEKYGIEGLKTLAKQKFEVTAADHWCETEFLESAEEAYTSTVESDRGLRDVVLQSFRQRPELASRPDVQKTVQYVPSLAFDLYRVAFGIPTAP